MINEYANEGKCKKDGLIFSQQVFTPVSIGQDWDLSHNKEKTNT